MCAHRLLGLVVLAVVGACACGGGKAAPHAAPRPAQHGTATPATRAGRPSVAWTHAELLRRLAGRRIVVAGRGVRIDPATVVCGGVGPSQTVRAGQPAWARFRCLQPTFPPGSVVGPDAIFVVRVTGRRTFAVTGARLTRY
jgi:hypothetical protein